MKSKNKYRITNSTEHHGWYSVEIKRWWHWWLQIEGHSFIHGLSAAHKEIERHKLNIPKYTTSVVWTEGESIDDE